VVSEDFSKRIDEWMMDASQMSLLNLRGIRISLSDALYFDAVC
jgi:hypothetical protein